MRGFQNTLLQYVARSSGQYEEPGRALGGTPDQRSCPCLGETSFFTHDFRDRKSRPNILPFITLNLFCAWATWFHILPWVHLDVWARCSELPINPSWCPGRVGPGCFPPEEFLAHWAVRTRPGCCLKAGGQHLLLPQMHSHTGFASLPETLFLPSC